MVVPATHMNQSGTAQPPTSRTRAPAREAVGPFVPSPFSVSTLRSTSHHTPPRPPASGQTVFDPLLRVRMVAPAVHTAATLL